MKKNFLSRINDNELQKSLERHLSFCIIWQRSLALQLFSGLFCLAYCYEQDTTQPQKERRAARERIALDRHASFSNFHPTDPNALLVESLLTLLQRHKRLILYLLIGALIAEHLEFLQNLHLFRLRPIRYEKHLIQPKSAGTPYDIPHIVLLTDVMKQQIPSWSSLLSLFIYLLHHQYIISS